MTVLEWINFLAILTQVLLIGSYFIQHLGVSVDRMTYFSVLTFILFNKRLDLHAN